MAIRNTFTSYGSFSKFFHWLIFLLVLFMLIYGFCLSSIPKKYAGFAFNIHKLTGLTILCLMILRGLWALANPKPILPGDTLPWQRLAERAVHYSLYFAIIAMPLSGWIGSTASGHAPTIGSITLGFPIRQDKAISNLCFNIHGILAIAIIVLVCVHVFAALYHHFIRRDGVLRRMMPGTAQF